MRAGVWRKTPPCVFVDPDTEVERLSKDANGLPNAMKSMTVSHRTGRRGNLLVGGHLSPAYSHPDVRHSDPCHKTNFKSIATVAQTVGERDKRKADGRLAVSAQPHTCISCKCGSGRAQADSALALFWSTSSFSVFMPPYNIKSQYI